MKQGIIKLVKLLLAVALLSGSPVFVLLLLEDPPVNYAVRGRLLLTPIVAPGGILKIKISADISKLCKSEVTRYIVDSTGVRTEYAEAPRPQQTDYVISLTVPLGAAAGPAIYYPKILWRCNIVQRLFPREVIQRSLEFTIAPSDGQSPMPDKQGIYEAPERQSDLADRNISP